MVLNSTIEMTKCQCYIIKHLKRSFISGGMDMSWLKTYWGEAGRTRYFGSNL